MSDTPQLDTSNWFKRNLTWLLSAGVILLLGLLGGGVYLLLQSRHTPVATRTPRPSPSPTPSPTPITKASPLTGLLVTPAIAIQPVVGVVIENHPDARPQSGLGEAGVVYEALAEGGITRFEAFFLDVIPKTLGPVRSLRTYFLTWGLEYASPVAHAGGNADALDLVSPLGLKDINGLYGGPGQYFYRTTDRYAPHNFYTSGDLLTKALVNYHFNQPATFTPSPRKPDTAAATADHPSIHIDFSYNGYQVDYKYVPATNDYSRILAGQPHIDRNTGAQIKVKNIVVEFTATSYGKTRIGEDTVIMQTTGQGKAIVLRDGTAVVGTWKKSANASRTELLDANGAAIPLDAGNTWYEIVPTGNNVSY